MNSSRIEKCGQGRPDRDSPIYDPDGQKADQSTVTNHQPSHQLYNFLSIFSFSLSLSFFLSFPPRLALLSFLFLFFRSLCVPFRNIGQFSFNKLTAPYNYFKYYQSFFFISLYCTFFLQSSLRQRYISKLYHASKERKKGRKQRSLSRFFPIIEKQFKILCLCLSMYQLFQTCFFSFFLFLFLSFSISSFFSFVVHQRNRMPWTER